MWELIPVFMAGLTVGVLAGLLLAIRLKPNELEPYLVTQADMDGQIAIGVGSTYVLKDGKRGTIEACVLKGWSRQGNNGPFVELDSNQYVYMGQFWHSVERINGRIVLLPGGV